MDTWLQDACLVCVWLYGQKRKQNQAARRSISWVTAGSNARQLSNQQFCSLLCLIEYAYVHLSTYIPHLCTYEDAA